MSDVIRVNSLSLMKAAFLPSFPNCKRFIILKVYLTYTAEASSALLAEPLDRDMNVTYLRDFS